MITGVTQAAVASRFGAKGPRAPAWLESQGIVVPKGPNQIARWNTHGGGRCLRLGHGEFLIEHEGSAPAPVAGEDVWLLLRSDFSVVLDGPRWPGQLAQVCSFDFRRFETEPDLVVMTLLAGIGVTLVREPRPQDHSRMALRLWCDASYTHYLQDCLRHLGEPP
jgi:hypothetical protein